MAKKIALISIATILVALSIFAMAQPTQVNTSYTLVPMTVKELAQSTDNILIGKVTRIQPSIVENTGGTSRVWTDVVVEVEKYLKVAPTERYVTLRLAGGRMAQVEEIVSESVTLNEGERVLLFIKKELNTIWGDNYFVHGMIQGKYLLKNGYALNQDSSRNTMEEDLVTEIIMALNKS